MTQLIVDKLPRPTVRGAAARGFWPLAGDVRYLNHGSFGATPHWVAAARRAVQDRIDSQPCAFFAEIFTGGLRPVAEAAARFVGADPAGFALVENATQAANTVLAALDLRPGQAVLVTDHGYNAVRQALRHWVERRGGRVVCVPLPCPLGDLAPLYAALADTPDLALAIIDHITSPSAAVLPVAAIAAAARAAGVPLLIDGAHAPGQIPLDVRAIGADFYTGNFHKWAFAPSGAAFLAVAEPWRGRLHPLSISHHYGAGLEAEFDWTGTRDVTPWLALPAAFAFHAALGGPGLMADNQALAATAGAMLAAAWGTHTAIADPAFQGAMSSVALPAGLVHDPATALALHDRLLAAWRIEVPVLWFQDRAWLRISAQAYNAWEEYERLARVIAAC